MENRKFLFPEIFLFFKIQNTLVSNYMYNIMIFNSESNFANEVFNYSKFIISLNKIFPRQKCFQRVRDSRARLIDKLFLFIRLLFFYLFAIL